MNEQMLMLDCNSYLHYIMYGLVVGLIFRTSWRFCGLAPPLLGIKPAVQVKLILCTLAPQPYPLPDRRERRGRRPLALVLLHRFPQATEEARGGEVCAVEEAWPESACLRRRSSSASDRISGGRSLLLLIAETAAQRSGTPLPPCAIHGGQTGGSARR